MPYITAIEYLEGNDITEYIFDDGPNFLDYEEVLELYPHLIEDLQPCYVHEGIKMTDKETVLYALDRL